MNIFISISSLRLYFFNLFTEISASLSKGDSVNPVDFVINTKMALTKNREFEDPLCCCEYRNRRGERAHVLGLCCDCEDLDRYGPFSGGLSRNAAVFVRACAARSVVIFCGATVGAENF
jgi:hypothetical protein